MGHQEALVLGLVICLAFAVASQEGSNSDRVKKLLPVFQVVRFPNDPCVGSKTNNGTCYTAEECSNKGGTSDGSCAEGFGVCCTFTFGCGTTTSENCTYFTVTNAVAGACNHKLCPDDNVCSIRLDFTTFVITGPTTISLSVAEILNGNLVTSPQAGKAVAETGQCQTDTFSITGQTSVPTICGTNTGEHVYFDANQECHSLDFNLGNAAIGVASVATRTWTIKATQIPCTDRNRPPQGCTQYFYGSSNGGYITTFNIAADRHLASQRQTFCFRREQGMCRICYSADAAIDVSIGTTIGGGDNVDGLVGGSQCCGYGIDGIKTMTGGYDCIMIPGALKAADNVPVKGASQCGHGVGLVTKTAIAATTAAGGIMTVCSKTVPFTLTFRSDHYEFMTISTESANKHQQGLKLRYFQTAC